MKNKQDKKKKLYQKWWFWVIVLFALIGGCSNSDNEVTQKVVEKGQEVTNVQPKESEITKETEEKKPVPQEEFYIIGSDKETVRNIFKDYKEKSSPMGEGAIDFDSKDLLVTVFFNNEKADGVIFLSNNLDDMNTITGEGSYVSEHYDELLKMATNDDTIKIETDLSKFNSQGNKKAVAELYIGNTPYNDEKAPSASSIAETAQNTDSNTEKKEESEFSYCLESGIRAGVKIYLKPSNDTYVGTISAFSDDMYDERGKKAKGVYLSNGVKDGWYKRSDIKKCYVRKDDPNLPSDRLVY